ncbi:hypothetical protein N7481_003631 [Penicillium waksmanii]|uniref:uncharacterized protein n=1 Tax=Penicillium waksmanii TaxID=69791 RepID=UPI0025473A0E|nr:uncharacterized protein N7481_003631 [Penicillium waksmanii]KAJ5988421.1 hypothetical protein N7481_003631 [Penicillium waksmanii]
MPTGINRSTMTKISSAQPWNTDYPNSAPRHLLSKGDGDEHEHEHYSADDPETLSPVDSDESEFDEVWHEAAENTDILTSTDESEFESDNDNDNDIFMDAFEYIADDECSSPGPDSRPATPFLDLKHPEWLDIVDGVDAGRVCQPVERVYPHYRARTSPGERGLVHVSTGEFSVFGFVVNNDIDSDVIPGEASVNEDSEGSHICSD